MNGLETTKSSVTTKCHSRHLSNELSSGSSGTSSGSSSMAMAESYNHHITHAALRDLLTILKLYHPNPPTGSRTVMKTPRMVDVVPCLMSIYYVVEENILQEAKSGLEFGSKLLTISINIDGLPLHRRNHKNILAYTNYP
ncbi:hypothetical protein J437_LFUL004469 [Ladona fulva]|uniref:Uncharacterized protein n=1 Tax=Ladona fulva TaxID=123851 RepID=A0A8K0NXR3_LADFU|nr:hypothetical protein J437_LFUL004469 [Ladona fulva]